MALTNLDQPLFDGAGATKRDLVDYLDAVRDRIIPVLEDRPLSVIRVHRGQEAFMQKNVPKYTPDVGAHGARSGPRRRSARCPTRCATTAARCCGSPTSGRSSTTRRWSAASDLDHMTHLVLDLDPPEGDAFPMAVARRAPRPPGAADVGLDGAVKTSGAKGVHVFVPIDDDVTMEDAAAATRAIAARAERLDPASPPPRS